MHHKSKYIINISTVVCWQKEHLDSEIPLQSFWRPFGTTG